MSLADPHRPLGRGTSKSKKALRRKTIGELLERPQVSAGHRFDVAAYYKMAEGGSWTRLAGRPAAAEDVLARLDERLGASEIRDCSRPAIFSANPAAVRSFTIWMMPS
ncbi:MAG TPA: hypothetical protein VEK34_16195 [Methylocella sp.]|nr:hypothetical protein [Methylocella sp.]